MKLHFENILTIAFFVSSILILGPACSKVTDLGQSKKDLEGVVVINP
jgi:hypothetical protein